MRPGMLLAVIAVIAAIVIGASLVQKRQAASRPARITDPPAGAQFIDPTTSPADVVGTVYGVKKGAPSPYLNMWVPEPGWEMGVEEIGTASDGGMALKQWRAEHPGTLSSGFWLDAVIPPDSDVHKGDHVFVSGRIDTVESFKDGGPVPAYRVVLRDAKAVSRVKR